jgi:cation:H+ antiporter
MLVVAGFAALYQGGNALLSGAGGLARQFGVPPLLVGLTVVAFATSSPELAVSVIAAFQGSPDIAVGNVLGSNIFNTLVAIGAVALMAPVQVDRTLLTRELPLCILATLLVGGMAWTGGGLERWEGGLLVLSLLAYLGYLVWEVLRDRREQQHEAEAEQGSGEPEAELDAPASAITVAAATGALVLSGGPVAPEVLAVPAASVLTILNASFHARAANVIVRVLAVFFGLGLLVFGSDALVEGARTIALSLGVSEATVGLTVVAIGTSAPELATAMVAVRKGQHDIGLGNALGSNLFNLLGVLGIAALIHPVAVSGAFLRRDLWVALIAVGLLVPLSVNGRMGRPAGILLTLLWLGYTAALVAAETLGPGG